MVEAIFFFIFQFQYKTGSQKYMDFNMWYRLISTTCYLLLETLLLFCSSDKILSHHHLIYLCSIHSFNFIRDSSIWHTKDCQLSLRRFLDFLIVLYHDVWDCKPCPPLRNQHHSDTVINDGTMTWRRKKTPIVKEFYLLCQRNLQYPFKIENANACLCQRRQCMA